MKGLQKEWLHLNTRLEKKLVNTGASMAVGVAITCTTGLNLETPYRVFDGPEIVGEGSRDS